MFTGDQNSLVPFVRELLESLLKDFRRFYPEIGPDFDLDLITVGKRLTSEGLGFATKTLPRLGKCIDLALLGCSPLRAEGFKYSGRSAFPAFLRGLLGLVFDKTTGMVLQEPMVSAISDLRQICYIVYKLEVPYDDSLVENCVNKFTDTDSSLPISSGHLTSTERQILLVANVVVKEVLRDFDPLDIIPQNGPGELATGEKPWEKFTFSRRYEKVDTLYDFESFNLASYSHFCDIAENNELKNVEFVASGDEWSKLAVVPKDSRGPRLIAMEPHELMWIQQGIKARLYKHLEEHWLTKGHVNFTKQEINRELALKASLSAEYSTLDMSDASDRVSLWLVKEVYKDTSLLDALLATRSSKVRLPDGSFFIYKKFAPMGSALCFPIEALTFWALTLATWHVKRKLPLLLARRLVWVYGDDIITRGDLHLDLLSTFPSFGLKFNEGKCCTTGYFRESCGMDAYKGESITPIRVKKLPPVDRKDASSIVAYATQSNLFWERGYYSAGNYLKTKVEEVLPKRYRLPVVTRRDVGFLAWYCRVGYHETRPKRWSKDLQRYVYKSVVVKSPTATIAADDWSELLRHLVFQGKEFPRVGVYPERYRIRLQESWGSSPRGLRVGGLPTTILSVPVWSEQSEWAGWLRA